MTSLPLVTTLSPPHFFLLVVYNPDGLMDLEALLNYSAFEVDIVRWALALLVVVLSLLLFSALKRLILSRIDHWSNKSRFRGLKYVYAILRKTTLFLFLAVGIAVGIAAFEVDDRFVDGALVAVQILIAIQLGIWLSAAATVFITRHTDKIDDDAAQVTAFSAVKFVIKLVVWSVVFLMIIENLGFDITALVASLGIGGIAIALAAQNILGDLFAFFSIIVDKPFIQGDFIIVDDHLGSIEHIGIKTTRIRSLSGEQLIFSNQDLLSSRIRNFKRMQERRVVFEFGVTYSTDSDDLREIPTLIEHFVDEEERARYDRAHFKSFGESSLRFEVVYWVLSADFNVHMDIQQKLLFELLDEFRGRDIDFAFPTRTVHLNRDQAAHTDIADEAASAAE